MPVYSIEQLLALKDSDLVVVPEFKWNDIEKVPSGTHRAQENTGSHGGGWRRGSHNSHHQKRPVVMPKAAIPFSQRALFEGNKTAEADKPEEEAAEVESDDDEFAARYLLRSKPKTKKAQEATDEEGAPVVNLTYAAALAASMKMSEASDAGEGSAVENTGDEDGWVSVSHQGKPRRNRNKGSFSKWRT